MRFPAAVRASLTVMFMLPAAAFAQASSPHAKAVTQEYRGESMQIQPETYGTSSLTYISLSPFDFHPTDSGTGYSTGAAPISIYLTGGGGQFEAPVRLPEGALVSYLELYSCGTAAGISTYFRGAKTDTTWSTVNGPVSPASGCSVTSVSITPAVVIDNSTTSYTVEADFHASDFALRLAGFRIGYKLQISPAPGTATFTDVPVGSTYHRFVEALVAAGITGGCGGGNYCPDAPVTRGQIAVFLSAALGLHWAP